MLSKAQKLANDQAAEVDRLIALLNDARGDFLRCDGLTADYELSQVLTGVTRLMGWHDERNALGRRLLGEVGEDCDPGGPGHDDVHLQLWSGGTSEYFRAPMLRVLREDVGQLGWTCPVHLVELLAEHGLCRSPKGEAATDA